MVARNLNKKKKPVRALPRRVFRDAENLPGEPTWEPLEVLDVRDSRVSAAFNFYNYADIRDREGTLRKWSREWAEANGIKDAGTIDRMEHWRLGTTAAFARMQCRGAVFEEGVVARERDRLRAAISRYAGKLSSRSQQEPETPVRRRLEPAVQEAVNRGMRWLSTGGELSLGDATPPSARAAAQWFRSYLEDLAWVESTPLMLRAWGLSNRAPINTHMERVRSIIDEAEGHRQEARTPSAPRRRKEKPAAQLVAGLRFLPSHDSPRAASIDPVSIVGSSSVWTYNIRSRVLRCLTAVPGQALSVSGSTVTGFDPALSSQKVMRRPEEGIAHVLGATPMSIKNVMANFRTSSSVPNGRVNGDTVILRAFR